VLCFVADFNAHAGTIRLHARPSLSGPGPAVKIVLLGKGVMATFWAMLHAKTFCIRGLVLANGLEMVGNET
jgi:hypothetical protein